MKQTAKQLFDKMVDYKLYAVILLAVGVFFYLGVIIPSTTNSAMDINIMMVASSVFLAGSIFFFAQAKTCKTKLLNTDEGQEYLMKK